MDYIKLEHFAHHDIEHNFIIPADSKRDEFNASNATLMRLGKRPKFVFLGDSLTQGFDVNSYFGDTSFCVNRGIGGDVPMFICRRLDADVIQLRPDYCVLLAGVNEIWCLDQPLDSEGYQKRYELSKGYIIDYISQIIERCRQAGQKLIVCSITPTYRRGKTPGKNANQLIVECNSLIERLAKENGCVYVDYHSHFCAADGLSLKDEYSADGVHLKPAGYDLMASVLRETLAANSIII